MKYLALAFVLGQAPAVSRAQEAAVEDALLPRTVPLEVLGNPQAFAGRHVALLCWVSMKELKEGRCPAYGDNGLHKGDVRLNVGAVSQRELAFVSAYCVDQGEPIRCLVLVTGQLSIDGDGLPAILAPRLE